MPTRRVVTECRRAASRLTTLARRELHAHAARGHEGRVRDSTYSGSHAPRGNRVQNALRPDSRRWRVGNCMPTQRVGTRAGCGTALILVLTHRVVTECRRAASRLTTLARRELHAHAARGHESRVRNSTYSGSHAPRGNRVQTRCVPTHDAGASGTACPRGAWAREQDAG